MSYIFDGHQDIADSMLLAAHGDFWKRNNLKDWWNDLGLPVNNQTDFIRLQEANVKAIFAVSCAVGFKDGNVVASPNHFAETVNQISLYHRLQRESDNQIQFITSSQELAKIPDFKLSFLLAIEGADSIDDELMNLDTFANLGVRSIGLTYSFDNNLAGGCNENGPLTRLGKRAIKRMNELGIILDLAHIGEKSSFQAIKASEKPVIMSHTACKAVFDHPRNATNEQLKAIGEQGGLVGICGVPQFMGELSLDKLFEHFDHAINLIGEDNVVIGSDFGGMTRPDLIEGFKDVSDMPNLITKMKEKGYSQKTIDKISHQNMVRVLEQVLPENNYQI